MPAPAPTPDALPLAAGPNGRPDPLTPRRLPWRKVPDSVAGPQTHLGERARCLHAFVLSGSYCEVGGYFRHQTRGIVLPGTDKTREHRMGCWTAG
jgi:hypothetical protein